MIGRAPRDVGAGDTQPTIGDGEARTGDGDRHGYQTVGGVEVRSIEYVPADERHGTVCGQGPFWFLGNLQFFTITIGFIGPAAGLSLGWSILAASTGVLFGTIFMALHATQGPRLGLPQMIQSRAQFGYRGVVVPLVSALLVFVGNNVTAVLLIAAGLRAIYGWNYYLIGAAVGLAGILLAVYGHDRLHRAFQILLSVSLPLLAIVTVVILVGGNSAAPMVQHGVAATSSPGGFTLVGFMAQFAAAASYNITYACYVSDYSRYLPEGTSATAIIGSVFGGAAGSAIWLAALGSWLAIHMGGADALAALRNAGDGVVAGLGTALALLSVLALAATVGMNNYSAALSALTGVDSVRPTGRAADRGGTATVGSRVVAVLLIGVASTLVGLALSDSYLGAVQTVLLLNLYAMVPWTAINLVDFFLIRHGQYTIVDIFTPNGSYGRWSGIGLVSFAAGLAAEVPFMVLSFYTGPAAALVGGADIAFVVGLTIAGSVYYLLARRRTRTDTDTGSDPVSRVTDTTSTSSPTHPGQDAP